MEIHREGVGMSLPATRPSRKQKFEAALKLAGMTMEYWRTKYYPVSHQHLNECFLGRRDFGPELDAAIEKFIADTFAQYATT
jgi:hypothetical protein